MVARDTAHGSRGAVPGPGTGGAVVAACRVLVAGAVLAAVIAQWWASTAFAARDGHPDTATVTVNLLSYFTIDSNLLAAAVLVGGVHRVARGHRPGRPGTVIRMSVTTYMVITGLVYNALLRGSLPQGATVAWSNEVLHLVGPAYLVLDWVIVRDRARPRRRDSVLALAFPTVWVAYTLIRGPFAHDPYLHSASWYPYPFINPDTAAHGYTTVAGYVAVIALVVLGVTAGLIAVTRWRPDSITEPEA